MKITKIFRHVQGQMIQPPIQNKWHSLFNSLKKFSKDFMCTRTQPAVQNRKDIL